MCSGAQPRTHTIRQGRRQRGTGTRCSLHRLFPVSASKSHFTHSPTGLHKTLNAWAERQPSTIGGVVPYPHAAPSKYSHKQDSNTIQHPSDCPKDHSTILFANELHNKTPNCLATFSSQIHSAFAVLPLSWPLLAPGPFTHPLEPDLASPSAAPQTPHSPREPMVPSRAACCASFAASAHFAAPSVEIRQRRTAQNGPGSRRAKTMARGAGSLDLPNCTTWYSF